VAGLSHDLRINWLLRGRSISISEYRCLKQDPAYGEQEQQPGHVIAFPRAGVFVRHLEGRTVIGDPNHVLLFNRDEVYRTSHPYGCGDHGVALVLDAELLTEIIRPLDPAVVERPGRPFVRPRCPMDARTALHQALLLRRHRMSDPGTPIAIEEPALALAARVIARLYDLNVPLESPGHSVVDRVHRRLAGDAMGLLARQYARPWNLPELARELHTSQFHLCRVFRRHIGCSVHRYLARLRLRASLEPLADGERDLTRLAMSLGYSSHSHFTAAFRREFGMPPSAVRRTATIATVREMSKILTAN
jgi:AraC family transcriptional regulator